MRVRAMVLAACLLLPAGRAWGTIWAYAGNVDPTTDNSAGPGLKFELYNTGGDAPQTLVATTDMYPAQMAGSRDGYAWLMNDGPTGKRQYKSLPYANINGNPGGAGATIVVRMKTVFKFSSDNENLGLLEDDGLSTGWHWSGAGDTIHHIGGNPGVLKGMRANDQSYTFTGMTDEWYADWHIIRVVSKRNLAGTVDIKVYFDENTTPLLQYTKARDKVSPDAFFFGTGSTAGQQSVFFDGLVATDGGGYAPGENAEFDAVVGAIAPEPGAVLLLLVSGVPMLLRRRR